MIGSKRILGAFGAAAFLAAAVFSVNAQDEGGEAAEAPAAPVKPRPAELLPPVNGVLMATKNLLLDVVRSDGQFVAVGDRGHILLSPDGAAWTQAPVPVRSALCAAYFLDPQNGWAVGHDAAIVRTQDGGKTWALQHFAPEMEKPLLDVLVLDANRAFAVGAYGLLLGTENGGQTWTEVDAPAIRGDEFHFNSIIKLANGDLFIAGESGMLGVSSDQGRTWSKVTSPYDSSLFGALPVGEKGALIFGLRGNAFLTQDVRGNQWTKVETNSVASMFGGTALESGELAMVGLNGVILITDATGKVRALQSPTGTPLASAVPLDGKLLAVGESGVQSIAIQ